MTRRTDFSLQALSEALNEARQMRQLSWAEVTREMNGNSPSRGHQLSQSTVQAIGHRVVAEADGVLQMLRWLRRSPESFVPGLSGPKGGVDRFPQVPTGFVLRFDTRGLHAALDSKRRSHQLTWADLGSDLGVGSATLTRLAKGGRTAFPQVMRMTRWLDRPAAHFTHASPW